MMSSTLNVTLVESVPGATSSMYVLCHISDNNGCETISGATYQVTLLK